MIEKMKMVHVVSTASHKNDMLSGLRELGLLHIAERKAASSAASARFTELYSVASELQEYEVDKKSKAQKPDILSDEQFAHIFGKAKEALETKSILNERMSLARSEMERIEPWGEFDPEEIQELRKLGVDLHFYRLGASECQNVLADETIKAVRLASVDNTDTLAVFGTLPSTIQATEFVIPDKGLQELRNELQTCDTEKEACVQDLQKYAKYQKSFQDQLVKAQNALDYSSAHETMETDDQLVWLSGYIPEVDLERFKAKATEEGWAYAVDDVSEEDEAIPTKLRYNKVSKLISPIYDILGILPGYREADISMGFLLFFALFFAMIIGDAGYGLLILAGTIAVAVKTKKISTPVFLLLVLSISTVIWGAVTGTWFGMEAAMKVPFLKALVLPGFANYPQYFGVDTVAQQNNIIKFSFTIGAIQMVLGSLMAVKKKIGEKNLSFMADLGWMITIVGMYLLSLYLVVGDNVPMKVVVVAIAIGFVLVILFGGMEPGKSFGAGIKSGLGGAFTTFLDTISCFGNVMSYIRLFAVGMAGLAISQSFNTMGASLSHGPLMIAAVIVVVLGHVINIVMCILSVVVHGVRLNVLEFSGQVGLEWTGIAYDPFKESDKIKK